MKLRAKIVIIGVLVAAAFGVWSALRPRPFYGVDGTDTRQRVLKRIPLGTKIPEAQAVMEANGFRCALLTHSRFAGDTPDGRSQMNYGPADILQCDSRNRFMPSGSRRWQVAFPYAADTITGVFAATTHPTP